MPGWKESERKTTFSDMPAHLQHVDLGSPGSLEHERAKWLEEAGLSFVDFMSWRRSKNPAAALRPPARRRLLSPQERAELDARLEREGFHW